MAHRDAAISATPSYRADIDGLRAVAIVPVVLFHAGIRVFGGGYVGVDIFFVISGYLITGVVAREIRGGAFSYTRFYLRRAKRILPALFAVLAATYAAGLLLLAPSELRDLGRLVAATSLSVSNILLWRDTNYFGEAVEFKPLLMTWSLGVEEQFYLLWPVFLSVVGRIRSRMSTIVLLTLVASLALSVYTVRHWPTPTFYLLPTRAWELLLGGWLALRDLEGRAWEQAQDRVRDAASVVGALLIVITIATFGVETRFPGESAILPCLGTALLIWAGPRAIVNRSLLSWKPAVQIGLMSYSLYLVHWPLLSFARIMVQGEIEWRLATAAVFASTSLAYVSWQYVETPFRKRSLLPGRLVLLRYSVGIVLMTGLGMLAVVARGLPARLNTAALTADAARRDVNPSRAACLLSASSKAPPAPECTEPSGSARRAVVWGDSHADALMPGLRSWLHPIGIGTRQITADACPPLLGVDVLMGSSEVKGCRSFNARALRLILEDRSVDLVILAARWAHYVNNDRFGAEFGQKAYLIDTTLAERTRSNSMSVFRSSLERTVAAVRRAGKQVVLVGPVPEMGRSVPDCLLRHEMTIYRWFGDAHADCGVSASEVRARVAAASEVIASESATTGVATVWPESAICGPERCLPRIGDAVLYSDDDHLSTRGAIYVAASFPPYEQLSLGRQAGAR